jgi:hypothetical protein
LAARKSAAISGGSDAGGSTPASACAFVDKTLIERGGEVDRAVFQITTLTE